MATKSILLITYPTDEKVKNFINYKKGMSINIATLDQLKLCNTIFKLDDYTFTNAQKYLIAGNNVTIVLQAEDKGTQQ